MNAILESKLLKLGQAVSDRYPDINSGGCCVYAAVVATELKKQGIQATGVVCSWNATHPTITVDTARELVSSNTTDEWANNGIYFSHVALEIKFGRKRRFYDTAGMEKVASSFGGLPVYEGRLTVAEMRTLSSRARGWNSYFKRRNIPAIRALVKQYLTVDVVQPLVLK